MLALLAVSALILCATEQVASLELSIEGLGVALAATSSSIGDALRRRRGRPRKFAAPSRAVTLTLPESVLEALSAVDPDPSRAIVQLAKRRAGRNGRAPAELVVFGDRAVITVRPTPSLERRAGVELVPLPDGRALISFDQPKTIADFELLLYDAIDDPTLAPDDRKVFEGITQILRDARRSSDVTLRRRSIIMLESVGRPQRASTKATRRTSR